MALLPSSPLIIGVMQKARMYFVEETSSVGRLSLLQPAARLGGACVRVRVTVYRSLG